MVPGVSGARGYAPAPPADFVLPFDLPKLGLRGRFVRLDAVATRALSAHPLPEQVQRTLGEALVLTALLGSALKLEGRMTMQTKSDGPLGLVVADFFAGGGLRGYARLDAEGYTALTPEDRNFAALTGDGVLAITIEPKEGASNYQGIVPLAREGLAVSAEVYFDQSEQLPTMLRLAAGPFYRAGTSGAGQGYGQGHGQNHGWCAGGLMLQATPDSGNVRASDDWQRVALFLETLEDYELLDTAVAAEDVLWRLFHEDEVRVHEAQILRFHCGCSAEKVAPVLRSYSAKDIAELADADGVVRARCEFCGAVYEFPPQALAKNKSSKES